MASENGIKIIEAYFSKRLSKDLREEYLLQWDRDCFIPAGGAQVHASYEQTHRGHVATHALNRTQIHASR